ncbi:MAG: ATP-binding cassette domain-containing protein [Pasteurella sp.]|nr:ATP-binding cassette domain-containing protein [Pasteurella sp.]
MIQLKNVSKIYGHDIEHATTLLSEPLSQSDIFKRTNCFVALKNINLTIRGGDIFCIMGLSGSGKSTLLRHINRLIEPTTGEVWYQDMNVSEMSESELNQFRQNKVAMVFQHFGLLPYLTVLDNVAYGLRVKGLSKAARYEKAKFWINEMGLSEFELHYPNQLSGGMKQRVGLARALAVDADTLLMDEPFSALDPLTRLKSQDLLLHIQSKFQKTIVFITHDVREAMRVSNQTALLHEGSLMQVGDVNQFKNNPANQYVEDFMSVIE